jgi:uncharacterized protein YaiI (UPF0178 family)
MRWIVDGMNVIGCRPDGWWRDRHGAMASLVAALQRWAAREDADVTVVFEQPPSSPITASTVTVTSAPQAKPDSADDEIVRLLAADPDIETTVVTSDRALIERVTRLGAAAYPAEKFRRLIES